MAALRKELDQEYEAQSGLAKQTSMIRRVASLTSSLRPVSDDKRPSIKSRSPSRVRSLPGILLDMEVPPFMGR